MRSHEEIISRLRKIGQEEDVLQTDLLALRMERQGLVEALVRTPPSAEATAPAAPTPPTGQRRLRGAVPLPVGKSIPRHEINALKAQIAAMDKGAFDTTGRAFIQEWYPKLAKTPAWHEISTTLQEHFGAPRQAVAGIAAHVAVANGKAHVETHEARA